MSLAGLFAEPEPRVLGSDGAITMYYVLTGYNLPSAAAAFVKLVVKFTGAQVSSGAPVNG